MEKVSSNFIALLVKKYCEKISFEEDEVGNFYCVNEIGSYTACFNETKHCFTEDFTHLESVVEYLEGSLEIDEIKTRDAIRVNNYLPLKLEDDEEDNVVLELTSSESSLLKKIICESLTDNSDLQKIVLDAKDKGFLALEHNALKNICSRLK